MTWIIIAVVAVWYILGVWYILNQMLTSQLRLSVTDLLIALLAGPIGLIVALAESLDSITIYQKKL